MPTTKAAQHTGPFTTDGSRPADLKDLNAGLYGSQPPPVARAEAHALGSHYAGSWEVTVQPSAPDPGGLRALLQSPFRQINALGTKRKLLPPKSLKGNVPGVK
ncbi:unnamed protein product [Urochloa humidicola]